MNWLIQTSLNLRVLVVAGAIALIIFGVRSLENVPLDVFPEFAPPVVEIQTEAPGISTEEVENLVTIPIENALTGIPYVKTVRSKSVLGLSSVRLIFNSGTDLLIAQSCAGAFGNRLGDVTGDRENAAHFAAAFVAQSLFENRCLARTPCRFDRRKTACGVR